MDRECCFLFFSDVVSSKQDHERQCPSNSPTNGPCVCNIYSFPDMQDLKAKLLPDSNSDDGKSKRTTIDCNDRNIVMGMKNFNNVFLAHSTQLLILCQAMIGTTEWLTASNNFSERVLLKCSSLFKELISFVQIMLTA